MSLKTTWTSILAALAIAGCEKEIPKCPDCACVCPSPLETKTSTALENRTLQNGIDKAEETSAPARVKPFSSLTDEEKKKILEEIAQNLSHTFPVPSTWTSAKIDALKIGKSYYEFGAERGKFRKHSGVDIYGYGKEVVALADGKVTKVGRYVHKFDHGNIILVDHGEINGYEVQSIYLHVGAVEVKERDTVKKGAKLAKTDCSGISDKKFRLLNPRSKKCREKAHLHFQLKVGDSYVYPGVLFREYAAKGIISGERLSTQANGLEDYVISPAAEQSEGSFASVQESPATDLYEKGKSLFHENEPVQWCEAKAYFQQVIEGRNTSLHHKSKQSIRTLERRLRERNYNCN